MQLLLDPCVKTLQHARHNRAQQHVLYTTLLSSLPLTSALWRWRSPHSPIDINNGAGAGAARGPVQQGRCHTGRPAQGAAQQVRACFWVPQCAAMLSPCTVRLPGCGMTNRSLCPGLANLHSSCHSYDQGTRVGPMECASAASGVVPAAVAAGVVALVCTWGDSVQGLLRHKVGRV